ncbi:MAG: hypothetical protein K0U76_15430 [Actinomycetia bacterium]|nr:hypothetical protein [Actinomycetes bacterium]MCH9702743.1 hypothetical protein [Actinomycetes bacterium]MCH9761595.1 hypothetical protein [Actinomycetes bacterium]
MTRTPPSPEPSGAEPAAETKGRNPWILPGLAITVLIVAVGLVLIFDYGWNQRSPADGPAPVDGTSQRTAVVELPVSEACEPECQPTLGEMVVTPSDNQHCLVLVDEVTCHVYSFSVPTPPMDGRPATGVRVDADGEWDWEYHGFAPKSAITLDYGTTYRARGWTIEPTPEGMRFTNDKTGHGMFVSSHGVEAF